MKSSNFLGLLPTRDEKLKPTDGDGSALAASSFFSPNAKENAGVAAGELVGAFVSRGKVNGLMSSFLLSN